MRLTLVCEIYDKGLELYNLRHFAVVGLSRGTFLRVGFLLLFSLFLFFLALFVFFLVVCRSLSLLGLALGFLALLWFLFLVGSSGVGSRVEEKPASASAQNDE